MWCKHPFLTPLQKWALPVAWILLLAPVMLSPLADAPTSADDGSRELTSSQSFAWHINVVLDWSKMILVYLLNTGLSFRLFALMPILRKRLSPFLSAVLWIVTLQGLTGLAWFPYELHLLRVSKFNLAPCFTCGILLLSALMVYFPRRLALMAIVASCLANLIQQ